MTATHEGDVGHLDDLEFSGKTFEESGRLVKRANRPFNDVSLVKERLGYPCAKVPINSSNENNGGRSGGRHRYKLAWLLAARYNRRVALDGLSPRRDIIFRGLDLT
jgi:hypothetical protein